MLPLHQSGQCLRAQGPGTSPYFATGSVLCATRRRRHQPYDRKINGVAGINVSKTLFAQHFQRSQPLHFDAFAVSCEVLQLFVQLAEGIEVVL